MASTPPVEAPMAISDPAGPAAVFSGPGALSLDALALRLLEKRPASGQAGATELEPAG